ncbi:MAG: autophagy protein 13 [Thelocarpon impressellum]|nr:MAG: autophagy protein 13 [Thelocarpon impressellum]
MSAIFNVEIDETDIFRDDWRLWKTCDAEEHRPPPMIIETYLDTANLTNSQSLVVIDDQGKRWNVVDALNSSDSSGRTRSKRTQVILERWIIELGESPVDQPPDLNAVLPVVYKKSIVLFRSLYTYSKFLPAWKFSKRLAKLRSNHGAFRVNCRILSGGSDDPPPKSDALTVPLFDPNGRITEEFSFGATECPAGPFSIRVSYRTNCEFRVDDSEALLSSHFMGIDDHFFRPSLDAAEVRQPGYMTSGKEVGSLPPERKDQTERPDRSQAYGSLSTFHQVGPPASSSPLTALRNARDLGLDSASASPPGKALPGARSGQGSKSSLRSIEGGPAAQRRPSVSFMPFKSPSLSASPSQAGPPAMLSSPRGSMRNTSGVSAVAQVRGRTPTEPPSPSFRQIPTLPENSVASSTPPSPRPAPATRYASSFGHRRGKLSSGGTSKTEDDNSSGKISPASSSAQPGSGMLTEGVASASSGSIKTDDDNISDFLKMLDLKKNLKSFEPPGGSGAVDVSSRRTSTALSKFQKMRDSNAALSDSMSSSSLLHNRSSSSSSRQLTSVPPMVPGTSISTASSPGKPISPHTPHTPAVPSRLSANSVAEYTQPRRSRLDGRNRERQAEGATQAETSAIGGNAQDAGSNAIDIPTSPLPFHPHNRRSSSVNQQQRVEEEIGDLLPFGIRSASMGTEDRPPLSLSALLNMQEISEAAMPGAEGQEQVDETPRHLGSTSVPMSRHPSSSLESRDDGSHMPRSAAPGSLNAPYRPRLGRTGGRGLTPPQGSLSSLEGDRGGGSGTRERPAGGRYSFTRPGTFEEDEPLLFAMSEIGAQQSRRSLEEGRGASSGTASERGGAESGSSSRRGNKRGGKW